jgi:L-fuconolactonase
MIATLDSHVHFWDRTRFRYEWLEGAGDPLESDFVPADLLASAPDLAGMVFVQADCRADQAVAEARWVSDLAAGGAPVLAIVAHAPLETDCRAQLAELAGVPRVAGVRRLLQDEAPRFALQESFIEGVRHLAEFSFSMDLCIRSHQLAEVTELVLQCPDVEFVLDHLGKPVIGPDGPSEWATDLAALAALPNVHCKLSGLLGEAPPEMRSPSALSPWLAVALEEFGADRCMFGSDWPVVTAFGDYADWFDVVDTALAGASAAERADVFAGTARRFYRVT